MIQPKYKSGQQVWILNYKRKVVKTHIITVIIRVKYETTKITYEFPSEYEFSGMNISGTYPLERDENEVFATKEDLINSL